MLTPAWKRDDRKPNILIITFSLVVFSAVVLLSRVKLNVNIGFDVHLFAMINAMIFTDG